MIKPNSAIFAVLIAAAFPVASHAATRDFGVDQRQQYQQQRMQQGSGYDRVGFEHFDSRDIDRLQERQRERILQGIRSGELTRGEASRLIAEQRMIQREERRYRADGALTRDERRDLWQDLNAAGRHIYNETHDTQGRF
jgi:hypothetical protein